jgi:DNA replication ATP-dependent helicase Dna2
MVRIGKKASCHSGVHPFLASTIALQLETDLNTQQSKFFIPTAENLRKSMSAARIVGVTALSIPRSPLLVGEHFDVVIVDEAGQITQPAIIGALMAAESFILVGDHMQLPPLVVSEVAEKGGRPNKIIRFWRRLHPSQNCDFLLLADFGVSMLKRLAEAHPDCVTQLTYQYRMHEYICQLSNDIVYHGKLQCANESVATRKLILHGFPQNLVSSTKDGSNDWLRQTINPSNSVAFVDTDTSASDPNGSPGSIRPLESSNSRRASGSIINETEAWLVQTIVGGLLSCGVDASSIGVICPFRAQLRLLEECSSIGKWKSAGLELSTIDRYQGRDKSVIILSFVRSNINGKVGRLLEDFRRLNVAVTRAKDKLIMVGSFNTLYKGSATLRRVLDRVKNDNHCITLPETLTHTTMRNQSKH